MNLINISAILVTLAALFSFLNHRFLKLPAAIGIMLTALLFSLILMGLEALGLPFRSIASHILDGIDFNTMVLQGMLGFLLFAGALHVNLDDLLENRWPILSMASIGVVLCTFLVGTFVWLVLNALGWPLPYIYCLLFGALISPTDPIAVLGILKSAGAPKNLESKITGESLFNDGMGVVVFLALLGFVSGPHPSVWQIGGLFIVEVIGGILLGLLLGYLCYLFLKQVDQYQVEIPITLAIVMGGYALSHVLHVSGPLAMAICGLMIGNRGRNLAMSENTRHHLDTFWELLDEILNAILFVLIGLEILVISIVGQGLLAGIVAIPLVLLARLISIGVPISVLRRTHFFTANSIKIMTWAGLRGGISIALALALPEGVYRNQIILMTYVVVIFSILIQGLTIKPVLQHWVPDLSPPRKN
ncbi:MAG: sodium:proton antiporter [Gammaproteobacteria bacterium]|nr:MAG: sodium:proton antiporter [Gammaproteobacteria bacterium]